MVDRSATQVLLHRAIVILRDIHTLSESADCASKLLLYKRLSDLSQESQEKIPILIPEIYRWDILKEEQFEIAKSLNEVALGIEGEIPILKGLLTNSETHYWDKFSNNELLELVYLFSSIDLSGNELKDISSIGQAYASFLESDIFSNTERGIFYTPSTIVELMLKLLSPCSGYKIYDPACRAGDFLAASVSYIHKNEGDGEHPCIFGQSRNHQEWRLAKTNLILHGVYDSEIELSDSITNPCFALENESNKFDFILCNPPFNLKLSTDDMRRVKKTGGVHFPYGIPDNGSENYLFIQHVISSLKKTGRAVMILPRGILSSKGDEYEIRKRIVNHDLIESVIQLAPKLFNGIAVAVVLVVFNKNKNKQKAGSVLFVDASKEFKEGRKQNSLQLEDIEKIISAFQNFESREGFSKAVEIREISENDYALNVSSYIHYPKPEEVDVNLQAERLHEIESERNFLAGEIDGCLRILGVEI